uniref:NADH-ubiquinone oxidoreductase chain 4 n=1 Tax=Ruditapes philippinarum TaxID=129788 RepID=Q7YF42_RUDPH|nr:NADH dehydrogenase subunit 4 [Ruditapes philippinarum]
MVCSVAVLILLFQYPSNFYFLKSEWLGYDELSILMIVLALLVTMMSLVSSVKDVKSSMPDPLSGWGYVESVILVCLGSVLFFSVSGWMDFFFFFEFSLIPTFFLILKWGYQPERLQACMLMILYTVGFSIPLFMMLIFFWKHFCSDNMLLTKMLGSWLGFDSNWIWSAMFLSFLVKLPVYGFHMWLPKAHVEAPLSGSMMLAGVLLKFGGYGAVRFLWFSEFFSEKFMVFLLVISLWGGVLSSAICVCQSDMKSLIAYSSISHMALSLSSLLSMYSIGKMSCVCLFFCHGLCSPILFSLAASSYDFLNSRNILMTKSAGRSFPMVTCAWFLFCILNMGFPPSLNFFGEVFSVASLLWLNKLLGMISGVMCFTTGGYCVLLYSAINHGVGSTLVFKPNINLSSRYLSSCMFGAIILLGGGLFLDSFFV